MILLLLITVLGGAVTILIWVGLLLKKEIVRLRADLNAQNTDLARLCRASLAVDRHLAEHDLRFHRLSDVTEDSEHDSRVRSAVDG